MPRFFFDVLEHGDVTFDNGGLEFDSAMLPSMRPLGAPLRSGAINFRMAIPVRLRSTSGMKMASDSLCGRSRDSSPLGPRAGLKRLCRERP
jgi:hypothetical protein